MENAGEKDNRLPFVKAYDDWAKNFDYQKWKREGGNLLILDDYKMLMPGKLSKELLEIIEKSVKLRKKYI